MNFKRRVGRLEKEFNVVLELRRSRLVCSSIKGLEEEGGFGLPVDRVEEPLGLRSCDRYFMNGGSTGLYTSREATVLRMTRLTGTWRASRFAACRRVKSSASRAASR
jgi:hypothetical protein